jgi:hypothetical protein
MILSLNPPPKQTPHATGLFGKTFIGFVQGKLSGLLLLE